MYCSGQLLGSKDAVAGRDTVSHLSKPAIFISMTLSVVLGISVVAANGFAQEETPGQRPYQGQTTPAVLGDGVESKTTPPVVTFEGEDEVFPEQEEGFQSSGIAAAGFQEIWAQRGLAMQRGDKSQEYRLLAQLQHKKEASGWPNLFRYGRILAREAEKAHSEGSLATAFERATAAIALAPQQPGVQAMAGKVLIQSPAHRVDGLKALGRSLVLSLTEPGHLRVRVGQSLFALWLSVLCASLVFAFIMALRSSGRMRLAVLERLPKGTPGFQAGLLVLLIVVTPILFGFGVTLTLVWWISFFGFWMRQAERLAAVVVLIWVTLLPLTLPFVLGHLKYPGSESELVYLAGRDMGDPELDERLAAIEEPSARVVYLMGMRDYWRGDTNEALRKLEDASMKPEAGSEVFTALGNLRFRDGQKTRAVAAYDEALRRDGDSVVALFNKSRVLYKMAEHSRAGEAHALASDIDLKMVTRLSEAAQEADQFYVADEPISANLLHADAWSLHVDDAVADSFWARFSSYERRHCALLGLIGLVVTFMVLFAKQTLTRAESRSRAKGFSRRRASDSRPPKERSLQIREQIREHRRQARLRRLRRVLGIVMAGGGHMIYGAPLTGLLFSCLFVMSLILYLVSIDLLPALVRIDEAALSLFGLPWGVLVVVIYIVSLVLRPEEDW